MKLSYANAAIADMARHAAVVDGLSLVKRTERRVGEGAAVETKKGVTIARNALI